MDMERVGGGTLLGETSLVSFTGFHAREDKLSFRTPADTLKLAIMQLTRPVLTFLRTNECYVSNGPCLAQVSSCAVEDYFNDSDFEGTPAKVGCALPARCSLPLERVLDL